MIKANNKIIEAIRYSNLIISKVAYGAKTVWEIITSCFGSGVWKKDNKWINSEIWKN